MKCPKCQLEIREGARFCKECGTKLELACPSCGHPYQRSSKFCEQCGHALEEPKPPPEIDYSKPLSYTPKHLADKILAVRPSIEGERKQVTVLFADVKGFTSISEKLDPEEVQTLISECLAFFTEEIHRYEGTIAQFLGDGVMALFGAPIAHEDAPQRALYAALAIRERLREYSEKLKKQGIDFNMRIGLNTGLVVVGRIGDDLTMEYTAMGDTVNLASRMESTAQPGMIQVSENTYRLTEGYFEFKPLGDIEVKGKKEPVKAYQLLDVGHAKTRLGVAEMRGLTRFVGRQRELDQLIECYERAKRGQGQVVGIVGEAGVGKSRLLLELRRMLPIQQYNYLEGCCLQYGGSMTYLPLLDILRACFGIKEGEREFLIKKKMAERIAQLDEKLKAVLPPLQEILSLKVEDEEYLELEPQKKREKIFEAIRDLLIRESQNRPLILAFDDLQWIDKTSEEFLNYFIGWLVSSHILLVLLYRPEYTHLWGSKSYYSQIRVEQLPINASAELVQSILEGGEVVPEIKELILTKAAGNPLFMEEFTHTLIENGSITKKNHKYVLSTKAAEIQVPDTIQGIIAGRMDRLEENLKRTMQVASVIGRDFAYRILHAITGMQEELKSYLVNLQGLEFIYEKSLFPELEYVFRHALTQEVAYNSLLVKKRKEIHDRIGKAIEELYPDRLEEFYEMLAYQYSSGENWEKAYQYLRLSGDKATRSYSLGEAFRFGKEAINALSKLPDTKENKRRGIEVRLFMSLAMMALGYPEDSFDILQEGERLSRELGDENSLAKLCGSIGMYYTIRGDSLQAKKYLEDAFQAAEKAQDIELTAPIGFQLCNVLNMQGCFLKTAELAPRLIALLENTQRELESFGLRFNLYSSIISIYGLSLAYLGKFKEGQEQCDKALSFARRINDLSSIAYVEWLYGHLFCMKGDAKNGIEHSQNAIKCCEDTQMVSIIGLAYTLLGFGFALQGDMETGLKNMEKGLEIELDCGISFSLPGTYVNMSWVYSELGDLNHARNCAEKALELAQKEHFRQVEAWSLVRLGRVIGKIDKSEFNVAENYILRGTKMLDEFKTRPYYAHGNFFLGELYVDAGKTERAIGYLEKAITMY